MKSFYDYKADAGDRLVEFLAENVSGYRDQLKRAARLAGQQLEWLKPVVFGANAKGFYGGSAVAIERGAIGVVIADSKSVVTIKVLPVTSIRHALTGLAEIMRSRMDKEELTNPLTVLSVMKLILDEHGAPPMKEAAKLLDEKTASRCLGMLLAGFPKDTLGETLDEMDMAAARGVCPVMIGLVGPSDMKKGTDTSCGAWPIFMPLAPYVDAMIGA
jgi:hypothetical protein